MAATLAEPQKKPINNGEMDAEALLKEIRRLERVCAFFDNSNLFHATRSVFDSNTRINFQKFKEFLAAGRSIDCRFYYSQTTQPELLDEPQRAQYDKSRRFYEGLADMGFHLTCLPLRERIIDDQIVPTEKGLDCEIVYDMCSLSQKGTYKTFILVAGDEDYARTVKRIRSETGMIVDVAFFGGNCASTSLVKEASHFINLTNVHDIFKDRPRHTQVCRNRLQPVS